MIYIYIYIYCTAAYLLLVILIMTSILYIITYVQDPAAPAEVSGAAAPPLPEPLPDHSQFEPWLPGDVGFVG